VGPARVLVTAEDEDLAAVGDVCRRAGLPWAVIGRGSNLLVADAGWPGVAIVLGRGYRGLEVGGRVRAGAAEPLPTLAVRIADAGYHRLRLGLLGARHARGCRPDERRRPRWRAGDHLVEAELFRLGTATRELWPAGRWGWPTGPASCPPTPSWSLRPWYWTRATRPRNGPASTRIRTWRRAHQPLNEPNCGSVFTNPPGDSAGRLIDAAGCKGLRVGGSRGLHAATPTSS
jgi:UDP-N-acetylmuramate dehydrogenase